MIQNHDIALDLTPPGHLIIEPFNRQVYKDNLAIPAMMVPTFRVSDAFNRGKERDFLINTWGGLGDQVCAEPTMRYAFKKFTKCRISLCSTQPALFSHLPFKEVFDSRKSKPNEEDYFIFQSIVPPSHLLWEFVSHMLSHCVDFPSICMFRTTLPHEDKEIQLPDYPVTHDLVRQALSYGKRTIVVHAGRHWPSKTFPKAWWDKMIEALQYRGFIVALIGQTSSGGAENTGFVDTTNAECLDLRDRLSIEDLISLLKRAPFLLSNDSSPIHIAAAGDAFIGMIASCKHPDYITHWRRGVFGYKTKNFGRDGAWNHQDYSPAQEEEVTVEQLPIHVIDSILPEPESVAQHYAELRDRI